MPAVPFMRAPKRAAGRNVPFLHGPTTLLPPHHGRVAPQPNQRALPSGDETRECAVQRKALVSDATNPVIGPMHGKSR